MLPCGIALDCQRLREKTLKKLPGPPGWGIMWWANSLLIGKNMQCYNEQTTNKE